MPRIQEIGPASTPILFLENNSQRYQQETADWERNLRGQGLDPESYAKEIQTKQEEIDQYLSEFESKKQMMLQSQKFVNMGFMSPEESQEAMWRIALRDQPELLDKIYPKESADPQRAPFSPGQMENYQETIEEFAASAVGKKYGMFGWDWAAKDKPPTQKLLLEKYNSWKVNIGYSAMTSSQQGQIDNEWDAWVADKGWNWKPDSKEILAARAKGPLTKDYGAPARGTPTGPTELANPMADSIAADLSKRRKPEPKQKPEPEPRIWARNRSTKKRMFSDDGGQTWQAE